MHELIAPLLLGKKQVSNMKGRDQRNLMAVGTPPRFLPSADEFLFVYGKIVGAPRDVEGQDFSVEVTSTFLPSEYKEMLHAPELKVKGLPESAVVEKIGRVIPLRIQRFRMGFDIFQASLSSSFFGSVPTVTQTLLVEADERRCDVSINADGLKSRDQLPLTQDQIFERLGVALRKVFQFDLAADYQNAA